MKGLNGGGTPGVAQDSKFTAWPAAAVLGVALLFAWTAIDDDPEETSREVAAIQAEDGCKQAIESRLKSPSSAEFDLDVTGGPDEWTCTGTVDAANSFGAMLRSEVTVVIQDRGDRWRVVGLSGLG